MLRIELIRLIPESALSLQIPTFSRSMPDPHKFSFCVEHIYTHTVCTPLMHFRKPESYCFHFQQLVHALELSLVSECRATEMETNFQACSINSLSRGSSVSGSTRSGGSFSCGSTHYHAQQVDPRGKVVSKLD